MKTIMEMVTLTRLDCAVASAGLMRAALAKPSTMPRHRTFSASQLVDQPLMSRVLADLALDVEAATALSSAWRDPSITRPDIVARRGARAHDPLTKYWVCKIAPACL